MSIPKVINYCWFGKNQKPALAKKCIDSWKKYCPDYLIVEWNEDNFDVSQNQYCYEAYKSGKWAFVTDYARLKILYENGGFYFDTDVELKKGIDFLLNEHCFMGIEKSIRCVKVNTGLGIGCEPKNQLIKEFLESYEDIHFLNADGSLDLTTCTVRNTEVLKKHGYVEVDEFQRVLSASIYPSEYFSPIEMESGILRRTKKTVSVHHYSLSWTSEERRKLRIQTIRKIRISNGLYNIRVLPNRLLLTLLGKRKYEKLKGILKRNK